MRLAAEVADEPVAVLFVEVHHELGVAARAEAMAPRLEVLANGVVVVELAADHTRDRAVFVRDGLRAPCDVDEGEPGVAQDRTVEPPDAGAVGPAVFQGVQRAHDGFRVG